MTDEDPWETFASEHHRGERLHLVVVSIVRDIGLFLELPGGIQGIVHLNDFDWIAPGDTLIDRYAVGESIEVRVIAIQVELQRVSLGIKQLGPDPRDGKGSGDPHPAPIGSPNPRKPTLGTSRNPG